MTKQFKTIIRLRRDNDYNYAKISTTFVPANGEVCLVDTATHGLQAVIGDGISSFSQLPYAFSCIEKGYFYEGKFYKDSAHTEELLKSDLKIYIDIPSGVLFAYQNEEFIASSGTVPASETTAGVMKLYSTTGANIDGTMTQKAITDELREKVEVTLNTSEELLIFTQE